MNERAMFGMLLLGTIAFAAVILIGGLLQHG